MRQIFLILIISLWCGYVGMSAKSTPEKDDIILFEAKKHIFYQSICGKPFSIDLLREALIIERITSPDIVFIQAQIESAHFTSDLFVNANNMFGMKLPRVRTTLAIGEYKGHAMYDNWIDCVKDYALWQRYYAMKGYDLGEYLSFLQEINYATDVNYITLIKQMS